MGIWQDPHQNIVQVHLHFYPAHRQITQSFYLFTLVHNVPKRWLSILPPQNIGLLEMPPLTQLYL